jgi:Lon protease-like protein
VPQDLLPLFPLPLVLLPEARLPLHVFEPRYRQLLTDCQASGGEFGIVYRPVGAAEQPPAGAVGCRARLVEVEPLPDGRSNILVAGGARFRVLQVVHAPAPYAVARVEAHDDLPDDEAELAVVGASVRALFERVARAVGAVADDVLALPELPPDPTLLAFAVAAVVDLELPMRQAMLDSRSALERLAQLDALLGAAVAPAEERARVHVRSRSNGQGTHPTS